MNVYVMKDNVSGATGELMLASSDDVVYRLCKSMVENDALTNQIGFSDIEVFRIGTFDSGSLQLHSCNIERVVMMRSLLRHKFCEGVDCVEES